MLKFFANLFKPAAAAYSARQDRKNKELVAKLEHDAEKLKTNAELVRQGRSHDADWELAAWRNSGYKDEFWSYTFGGVFILNFVPGVQPYIERGIATLSTYPQWFVLTFAAIVLASHGIRLWRRSGW